MSSGGYRPHRLKSSYNYASSTFKPVRSATMSIETLGLNDAQRKLFNDSLTLLDNNYAPPLL